MPTSSVSILKVPTIKDTSKESKVSLPTIGMLVCKLLSNRWFGEQTNCPSMKIFADKLPNSRCRDHVSSARLEGLFREYDENYRKISLTPLIQTSRIGHYQSRLALDT